VAGGLMGSAAPVAGSPASGPHPTLPSEFAARVEEILGEEAPAKPEG
jgi:hypothetical protein